MSSKKVKVALETGLHARPASTLVQLANKFKSDIILVAGDNRANAKSIMEVLSLGAGRGCELLIEASGEDENEAVDALAQVLTVAK